MGFQSANRWLFTIYMGKIGRFTVQWDMVLLATRTVCPLAIPESCAQNMGIRLLENHSLLLKTY